MSSHEDRKQHFDTHGSLYLVATVVDATRKVQSIDYHHLPSLAEARAKVDLGHIKPNHSLPMHDTDSPYTRIIGTHLLLDEYDISDVDIPWYEVRTP